MKTLKVSQRAKDDHSRYGRSSRLESLDEDQVKTTMIPTVTQIRVASRSDPAREVGSGLSSISAGLRLRYEIKREFAPYIGINWSRKLGGTADFARLAGEDIEDVRFVAGIRAWF